MSKKAAKSQAAMEYLITHAWSLLIIGLVFAMIVGIGIFSDYFVPRSLPGSCSVLRPLGPGTTTAIALEGICDAAIPEFVGLFPGSTNYFDINSNIPVNGNSFTIMGWININSSSTGFKRANILSIKGEALCGLGMAVWLQNSGTGPSGTGVSNTVVMWVDEQNMHATLPYETRVFSTPILLNKWYYVAGVYNGIALAVYINGQVSNTALATSGSDPTNSIYTCTGVSSIGSSSVYNQNYWPGYLSNLQLYNTSLTANSIRQLYIEGIGGAPINLQNLVGWWPLNGDAMDYSGNGYSGGPWSIHFNQQWLSATSYQNP